MQPRVSIVMPAYNSADYIGDAITSCLNQSYPNIELIVIDDGSQDDTVDIVASFGEAVTIIQQPNQGPAIARNTGIEAASGEFIQFCDSDDLLDPEKVARSVDLLQQHPQAALVYCKMQQVGQDGETPLDLPDFPPPHYFRTPHLFCKILAHVGSPLQTSTLLVRQSALQAVGKYRADPAHRCAEDWDLLLRLADRYDLIGLNQVLTYYRHHPHGLTQNKIAMAEGRLQTALYARDYTSRRLCVEDDAYDAFLGGRYHQLAMIYWRHNRRADAREQLEQALAITPDGRWMRRIMLPLTYILSARQFDQLLYWR